MNSTLGRCGSWSWRLVGRQSFGGGRAQAEQGESVEIGIKQLNFLGDFFGWVRFAKICAAISPVRPRESGDPGAKHSNVSKSGSPLPRGRTESVALSAFTHSILK